MGLSGNLRLSPLLLRLSWRQLKAESYFSFAMIANMALGLTGYLTVDGFNRSFIHEIDGRARQIAGGDLVVSSRQPFSENQLSALKDSVSHDATLSSEVSLVSMLTSRNSSRLVDLRFVDAKFPLYQGLELIGRGIVPEGAASDLGPDGIWIYRELQSQLAIKDGDRVRVGEREFTVRGIVADDPSSGAGGFSFAPRVFLPLSSISDTKLLGLGSRALFSMRYRFHSEDDVEALASKLKSRFASDSLKSDFKVQSSRQTSQETARLYTYIHDYLALISLVSLFLASIGFAYLIKSHLDASIAEIAIMSSLGAPPFLGFAVFIVQSVSLGMIATTLAILIASSLLPIVAQVMQPFAGAVSILKVPVTSALSSGFICMLLGVLLSVPQILRLLRLNPAFLFLEVTRPASPGYRTAIYGILPALVVFWLTSVIESRSWATGGLFSILFIAVTVVLVLIFLPLSRVALRVSNWAGMPWKWSLALRLLSRNKVATFSTFIALAIGATLINLIPQLRAIVAREVARPDTVLPQLFMFDIQDDQVTDVRGFFSNKNARIGSLQPMVRARLEFINQQSVKDREMSFEGEREQQQREALQARTQNLSYRSQLSGAESIVAGNFVKNAYDGQGLPALSIEEGFAKRVGVHIGDRMTFDVMGVAVEGEVSSIRRVRWTSFEPNFMILVQPGVLEDAPKIWVGSVTGLAQNNIESSIAELVALHSNISVVDVKSAVSRFLVFIDKTSAAIAVVAWLALLGGAGVLYAIAYARSAARVHAMGVVKVLGATTREASQSVLLEYGLIATAAIIFGVALSLGVSWGVASFVLNAPWDVSEMGSFISGLIILPFSLLLAWWATRRSLRVNITKLLA